MNIHPGMSGEDFAIFLFKQIQALHSRQTATLRILAEMAPHLPVEAAESIRNFERYHAEENEAFLLNLEKTAPSLAALLDSDRPLIPPTDTNP